MKSSMEIEAESIRLNWVLGAAFNALSASGSNLSGKERDRLAAIRNYALTAAETLDWVQGLDVETPYVKARGRK